MTEEASAGMPTGPAETMAGPTLPKSLSILMTHDHTKPIGFVEVIDGRSHVHFTTDMKITKDMAFQIFGNAGLQVLEATEDAGVMMIKDGRVLEWSLSPEPVRHNVELTGAEGVRVE